MHCLIDSSKGATLLRPRRRGIITNAQPRKQIVLEKERGRGRIAGPALNQGRQRACSPPVPRVLCVVCCVFITSYTERTEDGQSARPRRSY
jgi:hypothetical protein